MNRKILMTGMMVASLLLGHYPYIKAEEAAQKVILREVLSIGSLDDDVLYMWAGVVSDERGNIYLTDAMDYSLKKFDISGRLVARSGNRGQGPGEFLAPRLLSSSGRFLYATDQSLPGIQVFNHELHFQHRIPYPWPISSMKVLSDDRIALIPVSVGVNGTVFIINRNGEVLERIRYCEDEQEMLLNLAEVEVDLEGNVYLAYCFQDRIEKIDLRGEKVWSSTLLSGVQVKKKKIKEFTFPTQITFKSIVMGNSQMLYVLGGNFSQNSSRDVYVLDTDGRHLTTFTLPETSHCIYIDKDGFLYSRANEGTTLKKFELKFVRDET